MARWQQIVDEAPEFATAVQVAVDAELYKTLAALRRDGHHSGCRELRGHFLIGSCGWG